MGSIPRMLVLVAGLVLLLPNLGYAQEMMERLIRLEEGQRALNQRIDDLDSKLSARIDDLDSKLSARIDGLSQRIEDLRGLNYVILAGMFVLVGFVIWDRRTALAPAIQKNRELEDREDRIERAIKEFASKEPRLAEALKHTGLL